MNFEDYLKISADEINLELDNFFKSWEKEVKSASPKISYLNKEFQKASEGGKRLRGALVKLGFELTKSQNYNKEILKPALAYELFQTAILAHDDIIDKSDLRRGKLTLWKKLGGDHYGISQTICLGDIGFFLAYKLLAETNFPEKQKTGAISFFTDSMLKTALGEMLDIEIPYKGKGKEEDALAIFRLKTAFYTLIGPLQLGAVLAGAESKLLKNLEKFGEKLGIAFQIQDDILGVFGSEEILGKSVSSDIEEGKLTLLYLYALQHGGKGELEGIYGRKVGLEELEKVRKIFKESGALDYCQKKAEKLVQEAKKIIPLITKDYEKRKILEEMADYLVKRDK